MKLLFDIIKWIVGAVFSVLIIMTVLAAGATIRSYVLQIDAAARCSIAECEGTVATHQEALEAATAAYEQAVVDVERTFQEQKTSLDTARTAAVERAQSLGSVRDRTLDVHTRTFATIDLPPTFEIVTPAVRKQQVLALCERTTKWDARRCAGIFAAVPPATSLTTAAWIDANNAAIDAACTPGMADPGLQLQSWIGVCGPQKSLLRTAFGSYGILARAGDTWAEKDAAMQRALEEKDAYDAQIRALVETPRVTDAMTRAQEAQLAAQAELATATRFLQEAKDDPWRVFVVWLDRFWVWIRPFFFAAMALLLLNALSRPFAYFVLAPFIRSAGKLQIEPPSPTTDVIEDPETGVVRSTTPRAASPSEVDPLPAALALTPGRRQQNVRLGPDETLWVRPDYVTTSQGGGATAFYGGWRHPFTSYAVGLMGMTTFAGATRSKVAIGGTGDKHTDEYIGSIQLDQHPGVVIRPHHIVAVQGEVRLRFRWRFSLVALLRGQVRYVVAFGTGTIFVRGYGGVFPQAVGDPNPGRADMVPRDQLHDALLVCWDARLGVSLARNENWIHVALLKRGDMFETSLYGEGGYVQSHSTPPKGSPGALGGVSRLFDAVLGALGKVIGL